MKWLDWKVDAKEEDSTMRLRLLGQSDEARSGLRMVLNAKALMSFSVAFAGSMPLKTKVLTAFSDPKRTEQIVWAFQKRTEQIVWAFPKRTEQIVWAPSGRCFAAGLEGGKAGAPFLRETPPPLAFEELEGDCYLPGMKPGTVVGPGTVLEAT